MIILTMKFFEHGPTKPVDEKDKKLNTLGFALYDLIHITCAIIELVFIILNKTQYSNEELVIEVADEFTELILSFALIFFIIFIFKAKTETNTRSLYTFAWLMVSLSLIIPATYTIPSLYLYSSELNNFPVIYAYENVLLYLSLLIFLAVLFSLANVANHPHAWWVFLCVSMGGTILYSVFYLLDYFRTLQTLNELVFTPTMILSVLFGLAPIVPSLFAWFTLSDDLKHPKPHNDLIA
jgi:hypothetical protein